jgi:hypothetical protein
MGSSLFDLSWTIFQYSWNIGLNAGKLLGYS